MIDPAPAEPRRVLGGIDAGCIVIGAIVGVGIFFNPSNVVGLVHSAPMALLAWAIGGAIALCGALTFAELGARYHASGAQYEVLRDAYGPFPAFLFVFCNATAVQAGATAIIATVCVQYLAAAIGVPAPEGPAMLGLASLLIVGITGANILGVRWGARIQNFTVYAKVLTLLAVTGLAAYAAGSGIDPPPPAAHPAAPFTVVLTALIPTLFAYGGWQHALWISGEVRDPQRNLPRAIIGGVLIVIAVYLLANWAYLHLLGVDGVAGSKALAADAVAAVVPGAGRFIGAAVALSAFGVLNAQLLSGPRLVYGMARDGRFFSVFGRLSPRFGTPIAAIALIGGMALVLLVGVGPERVDKQLLTGVVFIDVVFFALTGAAVIVLRGRQAAPQGFRVPGYPVVPLLFVLGELGALVGAYLEPKARTAAIIGAAWIAVAALIYAACFRMKSRRPQLS